MPKGGFFHSKNKPTKLTPSAHSNGTKKNRPVVVLCRSASWTCCLGTEAEASLTVRILDALQRRVSLTGLIFIAGVGRDLPNPVAVSRCRTTNHVVTNGGAGRGGSYNNCPPLPALLPTGWSQEAIGRQRDTAPRASRTEVPLPAGWSLQAMGAYGMQRQGRPSPSQLQSCPARVPTTPRDAPLTILPRARVLTTQTASAGQTARVLAALRDAPLTSLPRMRPSNSDGNCGTFK